MKEKIELIINNYLEIFQNEKERLLLLKNYLKGSTNEELADWNNINIIWQLEHLYIVKGKINF